MSFSSCDTGIMPSGNGKHKDDNGSGRTKASSCDTSSSGSTPSASPVYDGSSGPRAGPSGNQAGPSSGQNAPPMRRDPIVNKNIDLPGSAYNLMNQVSLLQFLEVPRAPCYPLSCNLFLLVLRLLCLECLFPAPIVPIHPIMPSMPVSLSSEDSSLFISLFPQCSRNSHSSLRGRRESFSPAIFSFLHLSTLPLSLLQKPYFFIPALAFLH